MTKLFTDFKPADYETWLNQIKKDLKDKPLESLESNPEKDIFIKAYYHPQHDQFKIAEPTRANNFSKTSNNWSVRQEYSVGANSQILKDLNEGIDAISIPVVSEDQFAKDKNGIRFEFILSDIRFESINAAMNIDVPKEALLNFDIISRNEKAGEMKFSLDDFVSFYKKRPANKSIWIDGFSYGESGAGTIQELAFTLSHLNEYLQTLKDAGIDAKSAAEKVIIELSVNDNYFVNLAKFRASRELVALLFSAYDQNATTSNILIYAKTSSRFLALNDHNNNFLRQTTQAMSAILGGCNALTISNLLSTNKEAEILNNSMAKNIQLVLREESYLDKVIDPAAGSMYLENLTDQLIEKAWNLFNEIEKKGGFLACLKDNTIQNKIEENQQYLIEKIRNGKLTFLGVNKYVNNQEKWIDVKPTAKNSGKEFKTLLPFSLEPFYESKTLAL